MVTLTFRAVLRIKRTKRTDRFPTWARWGVTVGSWRIYGTHRGWASGSYFPAFTRTGVFVPFTPWGVGWRRSDRKDNA